MMLHETTSTIAPAHAAALVRAASSVQAEVRSFGEDLNEGYLLLHAALADALRRREEADPAKLSEAVRLLAKAKADPIPEGELTT